MKRSTTGGEWRSPLARIVRRVRILLWAIKKEKAIPQKAFTVTAKLLGRVALPPLDRQYVENQLNAAEGYLVEVPGYRGYFPGAGAWHLKQALARLLTGTNHNP